MLMRWTTHRALSTTSFVVVLTLEAALLPLLSIRAQAPSGSGASAKATPAPLGKLYDVGGHKMHLYQSGNSSSQPAVVLEAGASAFSLDWYLVQQEAAKFATVCSYDRAGHAWSELGPRPYTKKQAAYDLRRLLAKAGVPGPYVLVGHSLGVSIVRVFATEYPNDVAGMVLVDQGSGPSFINGKLVGPWDNVQPRQIPAPRDQIRDEERVLSKPELEGYKRGRELLGPPKIEKPYDKLPGPIQKLRLWAMSLPQSNVSDYNPYEAEESFLLFADRIRMRHPHGNKPLVVLIKKWEDQKRIEELQRLLNLSSNSVFAMSDFPVHEIQLAQPDLVVDAVRAVLEAVKTGKVKLPTAEKP
jgi:pimeloyl-ACP methyl ester carboxylesterase